MQLEVCSKGVNTSILRNSFSECGSIAAELISMNAETWEQLKSLFHSALEVEKNQRAAFLDQACDGNAELRGRVERLLVSHEEAGSFLISPALLDSGISPLADGEDDERAVHEK